MNREDYSNDNLDQALRRLGDPPNSAMEVARERVRRHLKTANVPVDTSTPQLDASPASLWPLRKPFIFPMIALVLIASVVTFAALQEEPEPLSPNALAWPIPDGPGKDLVLRTCTECHSLEGIERHVYDSRDEYRTLILSMVSQNGAAFSEEEITTVTEYLWETYGNK